MIGAGVNVISELSAAWLVAPPRVEIMNYAVVSFARRCEFDEARWRRIT